MGDDAASDRSDRCILVHHTSDVTGEARQRFCVIIVRLWACLAALVLSQNSSQLPSIQKRADQVRKLMGGVTWTFIRSSSGTWKERSMVSTSWFKLTSGPRGLSSSSFAGRGPPFVFRAALH